MGIVMVVRGLWRGGKAGNYLGFVPRLVPGACGKVIGKMIMVAACGLLPACAATVKAPDETYAKEAWAYFKKLCDEKSGEKIYKTYTGVKSVLVVKPLPPATEKDLYDQFWYGDPYSASATSMRVDNAAGVLVYPDAPLSMTERGRGFDFVESSALQGKSGQPTLIKYYYQPTVRDYRTEAISQSTSRFAISWEDISTPEDRQFWVAGSRLRIVDLNDNSVVAERIGYFIEAGFGSTTGGRRPWLTSRGSNTTCPSIKSSDYFDRWFILKVLNPNEGKQDGK